MLVLAHEVSGRLRFVSPALKTDCGQGNQLERLVRAIRGVTDVQVRRSSGSLIVLHDGAHTTRQAVLRSLAIDAPLRETRLQPLDHLVEAAAQQLLSFAARGVIAALL